MKPKGASRLSVNTTFVNMYMYRHERVNTLDGIHVNTAELRAITSRILIQDYGANAGSKCLANPVVFF